VGYYAPYEQSPEAFDLSSIIMPNETDWIAVVMSEVKAGDPKVPDDIWPQLEILLKSKLSRRPIPAVELANMARELIDTSASDPSGARRSK